MDSLIVTDLVELARNHAISDAVLLSGDEDVRIGVQIAQSFGVRVHLIGIEPRRGNQSRNLAQEADTTTEWSKSNIGDFMSIVPRRGATVVSEETSSVSDVTGNSENVLNDVIDEFIKTLSSDELREIANLDANERIPYEYDSKLLGWSRDTLHRNLSRDELSYLRTRFKNVARTRANPADEQ